MYMYMHEYAYCLYILVSAILCVFSVRMAFLVFSVSRFQVMEETSTSSGPAEEESETFIRAHD